KSGTVRLLQLPEGRQLYTLGVGEVIGLEFSVDGRYLLVSTEASGYAYDIATGSISYRLQSGLPLRWTPDGRYVYAQAGRSVDVFPVFTGQRRDGVPVLTASCHLAHSSDIGSATADPEGSITLAGRDGVIRVFRMEENGGRHAIPDLLPLTCAAFSPDLKYIATGGFRPSRIMGLPDAKKVWEKPMVAPTLDIEFQARLRLAAYLTSDHKITLLSLVDMKEQTLPGDNGEIAAFSFAQNHPWMAIAHRDGSVNIYHLQSLEQVASITVLKKNNLV
ncbi:MAG TPA: WD40 repeat domain-containing protein, partial [Terriglobales bacterium]|nr:WD40 repeat domain-containing protein [Terriglobales bacterium]